MRKNFVALALTANMALLSGVAHASTIVNVSGDIQGHAFTAKLDLDVVGNQAVSGTGTFTGYGFTNADLVLITASTPGNEPSVYGPIGFRGNDGTDFFGLDQNYPIDGLLFDVNTKTASFGDFPLFTVYDNGNGTFGAGFTGNVGGTEYYAQFSSAPVTLSTVPLPASAPMFGAALLGLAGLGFAANRKKAAAAA